jgi:hypothetical protein
MRDQPKNNEFKASNLCFGIDERPNCKGRGRAMTPKGMFEQL